MGVTQEIPLLAGLSSVTQAKVLGDLERLERAAGTTLIAPGDPADWVYFIVEGEVEIAGKDKESYVPLMILGPGDMAGELGFTHKPPADQWVRAVTDVQAWRMPVKKFERLVLTEPSVVPHLIERQSVRMSAAMQELARTKGMLTAYAEELWSAIPEVDEVAAAISPKPVPQPASSTVRAHSRPASRRWLGPQIKHGASLVIGVALGLLSYRLVHAPHALAVTTGVLIWATWTWLAGTLPDYVTAVAAVALLVVLGAVPASVALAGYASPSWFLLLSVLGIGVAVSRSGLLYRLALMMLRLLPPTYYGQTFALTLTGLLFTPLLPSANSRSALASPLARELSEAMRFPALGRGSAGLAMSSYLGFGQMYFMFLNGTNICMLAWSLLPAAYRQQVTWVSWFWITLPLGLLTLAGCYLATLWMFPPEPSSGVSRQTILAQIQVLGPMSRLERTAAWVLGLVLLGFITQGIHGLDPAWVALPGFLVLVSVGVVDKHGLKLMDWGFLLLVGALISLSEVTKATGLTNLLTQGITPILQPLGANPYLFLGAVALLTIIVRLAVPVQQAVLVMTLSLLPVALQMHYNPFVVVLVVLALSNTWILPQQNPLYMTVYSGTEEQAFTHRQVRPLALVHAVIGLLAVVATVPFWGYLGLLPK